MCQACAIQLGVSLSLLILWDIFVLNYFSTFICKKKFTSRSLKTGQVVCMVTIMCVGIVLNMFPAQYLLLFSNPHSNLSFVNGIFSALVLNLEPQN